MADKSSYGFKTPKDAEQGVLNLKKVRKDDTYKIRVALGVINRVKATIEKTPDPVKEKEMRQSLKIWEKFISKLKGGEEEEETDQDMSNKDAEEQGIEDAASIDMDSGDKNILTIKGQNRGLVVKLTKQGAYSIYYWKDTPSQRFPGEVYLDGKKVYMPVRLVHMGFEPDPDSQNDDDVGRINVQENKKTEDDPDLKGHQPKKYYKGLDKDTKEKREKHFKSNKKKDDDDPSAYKKAPGDSDSKTKPSKYTKKFKEKFSESIKTKINEKLLENKAVRNKAEKANAPYSIVKQVYDRGVAAWKSGHRPGTSPEQWGLARVNSFLTGGKTSKTADKDLYSKWKSKD